MKTKNTPRHQFTSKKKDTQPKCKKCGTAEDEMIPYNQNWWCPACFERAYQWRRYWKIVAAVVFYGTDLGSKIAFIYLVGRFTGLW